MGGNCLRAKPARTLCLVSGQFYLIMDHKEEWKDIDGFDGVYKVSNHGKIISYLTNPKLLAGTINESGYRYANLRKMNQTKCLRWHRIVAKAFLPNPNNLPEINHIDGNKLNNCVSNLEWCTRKQNMVHAKENGLMPSDVDAKHLYKKGESNIKSKLKKNEVLEIRRMYKLGGCTHRDLAKHFGISRGHVSRVLSKHVWTHI